MGIGELPLSEYLAICTFISVAINVSFLLLSPYFYKSRNTVKQANEFIRCSTESNAIDKIELLNRNLYHHAIVQIIVCQRTYEITALRESNGI